MLLPTLNEQFLAKAAKVFKELNEHWKPHPKQLEVIDALFFGGKTEIALETGRRFGKDECFIACCGIWAQLTQGSQSYYFAPFRNQLEKIVWKPQKIQAVCPPNWIDDMNSSDLIVYWAGSKKDKHTKRSSSWLQMDGCDKFDRLRGVEPKKGVIAVTELRDTKEEFMSEVIRPTLAGWNSPILTATTPPDDLQDEDDPEKPNWVIEYLDSVKEAEEGFHIHGTCFDNPHLSKQFLEREIAKLRARGEHDTVDREYLGLRVPKRKGRTLPMFEQSRHVIPHAEMAAEVLNSLSDWELYCLTDPAGSSVWAWNLYAINKFDKRIYTLDELDEQNKTNMTVGVMWPKMQDKILEWQMPLDAWGKFYDEAEAWFRNDMIHYFGIAFSPTHKASSSKSEGYSWLRDLLHRDMLKVSDRCKHTIWELQNHEGETSRDHHFDLKRYLQNCAHYTPDTVDVEPVKTHEIGIKGRTTPQQDWDEMREQEDWTGETEQWM